MDIIARTMADDLSLIGWLMLPFAVAYLAFAVWELWR